MFSPFQDHTVKIGMLEEQCVLIIYVGFVQMERNVNFHSRYFNIFSKNEVSTFILFFSGKDFAWNHHFQFYVKYLYETFCAVWYQLWNLENVQNTHRGMLLWVTKSKTHPWVFLLDWASGTKSRKAWRDIVKLNNACLACIRKMWLLMSNKSIESLDKLL